MRHLSKAVFIFTLAFQTSAHASQIFNYSDFTSLTGLSLVGSATAASGVVTLTPAVTQQAGALWFDNPVAVVDGFDTEFDYTIDQLGTPAADGIAFVIQTQGIGALGNPGADLGYGGIVGSVGVSFRAVYPILEINSCGPGVPTSPGNCQVATTSPASLQGSHSVEIRYTPGTLDILIDGVATLSGAIDLSTALNLGPSGSAYVGITGGTGGFVERNAVDSWALTTIPEPGTLFLLTGILPLLAVFRKKLVRGL